MSALDRSQCRIRKIKVRQKIKLRTKVIENRIKGFFLKIFTGYYYPVLFDRFSNNYFSSVLLKSFDFAG